MRELQEPAAPRDSRRSLNVAVSAWPVAQWPACSERGQWQADRGDHGVRDEVHGCAGGGAGGVYGSDRDVGSLAGGAGDAECERDEREQEAVAVA